MPTHWWPFERIPTTEPILFWQAVGPQAQGVAVAEIFLATTGNLGLGSEVPCQAPDVFFFFFLVLLRHWGGMWGECRSVALTAPLEWRDLSLRIAKQSSALFCVVICLFTLPLVFCFGSCPFSTHVPSLVVSFVVSWFSDLFSLHPLISLHISTLLF